MSTITLYLLQGSRSVRIAWLLEELGVDYELKFVEREQGVVPAALKEEVGGLSKFPTLRDGDTFFHESGNITEYLCDTYDKQHKLLPKIGDPLRYQVLFWMHAAEGIWAMDANPIILIHMLETGGDLSKTSKAAGANVAADMEFLEDKLGKGNLKFLCGDEVTAADCMMHFCAKFCVEKLSHVNDKELKAVQDYVRDCEATESYKRAIEKTGYVM